MGDHLLLLMKIKAMAAMVASVVQSSSSGSKLQTTIWTARIIFFSIGALSTFHLLKLAVPYSVNLLRSVLPGLWLYIGLNFIILTVAATSIFHHPPPAKTHLPIDPNEKQLLEETKEVEQEEAHDDQRAISSSPQEPTSPENSCSEPSGERATKTPTTTVDESDAGEKGSSMEATWKEVLKKSKTFDGPRRRREPWMGQEELHSRSEAFIRSFNERLRLQRQESDEQYMAMVSPGRHDKIALLSLP